jgi:maltooligosyltrehalose trehalohydrolase
MNLPHYLGAHYLGDGICQFHVWAPLAKKVEVHITAPRELILPMEKGEHGYFTATIEKVVPGSLYLYRLDDIKERPDPASRYQHDSVHGYSEVVDLAFPWEDSNWPGQLLQNYVIYELHVGAFTKEGTFEAIIPYLAELKELGITAIELMPVAQFPGSRNWGYDGVYPYAVQNSYGGTKGLQHLVNACHRNDLAVIVDVVYNHLGPEGNYLRDYGYYFTNRYVTPWGEAINFDGPYSDEVRRFFIENALYWVHHFHIDALRLDAVHAIMDQSPQPFVEELAIAVQEYAAQHNCKVYVIAESHLNDARLIRPRELGGYGLDAQWNDDFHHSLHVLLTGEETGYYSDFVQLEHLAKAFKEGYTYTGEYAPFWLRRRGSSSCDIPAYRFVVFSQNHDHVGNRMLGDRLSNLVPFEAVKVAASAVILSPFIPLLFMGEEYGETANFPYFVSHSDAVLIEAVRKGRLEEFAAFKWEGEPSDPQDEATFQSAKLNHNLKQEKHHKILLDYYQELLRLRREVAALANPNKEDMEVISYPEDTTMLARRWAGNSQVFIIFNFGKDCTEFFPPLTEWSWTKIFCSADKKWGGLGSQTPTQFNTPTDNSIRLNPYSVEIYQSDKK